jgi:hypothetical protein
VATFGEKLKEVIAETRKFKSENSLSMKAEMDEVVIKTESRFAELFMKTSKDIKACCHAKELRIIHI